MAWTNNVSVEAGDQITASWMNTYVKDNFNVLSTHTHTGASGMGSSALDNLDQIIFDHQGSDPSAPASGHGVFYLKSDGVYIRQTGGSATRLALVSELHDTSHTHDFLS
jgi:hypothetical protein